MSNRARPRNKRKSQKKADIKHARQMPRRDNAEKLDNGDWRVELPARHGVSPAAEGLGTTEGPVGSLNGKPHIIVAVEDEYTLILRPWPRLEALKHRLRTAKNVLLARPGR